VAEDLDRLRGALMNVLCNVSNFPARAQPYLLGQDMGPLIAKTVEAVLAAQAEEDDRG